MHIYILGIGGVAMGPLAEIAKDMGHQVSGSDRQASRMTAQLAEKQISAHIGEDATNIAKIHAAQPIDWLAYSSGIPESHPERAFAHKNGIRTTKRDELLNELLAEKDLKMIAVSGTHGKTTTTAMLVWLFKRLGIPVSYSIGTIISFGPSGHYEPGSQYFVYECDEYDRNFLQFKPHLSLLPAVDYDHPDIFPTPDDYKAAFRQFIGQSEWTILWQETEKYLELPSRDKLTLLDHHDVPKNLPLAGEHTRANAWQAVQALQQLMPELPIDDLLQKISTFPGTERRFEKLAENIYSDYAHHPAEIAASLQMARELNDHVVVAYEPHQNTRQHQIASEYKTAFAQAEQVYWLPTYLTREDKSLPVLEPADLIKQLENSESAQPAELNTELVEKLKQAASQGKLVVLMGAGPIDDWARANLVG